jgi:hypothetical protein
MKKIINYATSTSKQPFLGRSVEHMQQGISETADSIMKNLIRNYTTGDVVIIEGLLVTSGSPTAAGACTITAGSVYYNGEVYQVAAFSGTITGSNVIVLTVDISTFQAGDPVQNTDGNNYYVHRIDKMVMSQGATGSGTKDFSALKTIKRISNQIALTTTSNVSSGAGYADMSTMTYTTPNDGITRDWLILYKGEVSTLASTNIQLTVRIYNVTTSTVLDSQSLLLKVTASTCVNDYVGASALMTLQSLAPNTNIKIQYEWSQGVWELRNNKFLMVER